jgi:hypothetical protein
MGAPHPETSKRYQEMMDAAREYYGYLREARSPDASTVGSLKAKLKAIVDEFSDNPAYVAFLQMKRAAASLRGDDR